MTSVFGVDLRIGSASVLSSLGALGFILLATRALGLGGFAPVAQVWSVWAITAATITFSSQQTRVAAGTAGHRRGWMPVVVVAVGIAPIVFGFRERLFSSEEMWWPLACLLIPFGSYATGVARGLLASDGRSTRLAMVIGGENAVRCALAGVFNAIGAPPTWYLVAILAGFSVSLLAVGHAWVGPAESATISMGWLSLGASAAGLGAHSLLVLAPPALAIASQKPEVISAVFVLLALYRAPYQLFLGVAPAFSAELRRRLLIRGAHGVNVVKVAGASLALAQVAGGAAWLIGEPLLAPLFGAGGVLDNVDHAFGSSLTVVVGGGIVLSMILVAQRRPLPLLVTWPLAALVGVGSLTVVPAGTTAALARLLVVGATVLLVLTGALRRPFVVSTSDNP